MTGCHRQRGKGIDRVASHRGVCKRSGRDSEASNHTRGGGAMASFID